MAVNKDPIFGLTPNCSKTRLALANTTRDLSVTTNAALAFTAGANGARVERITFTHTAGDQTTASVNGVVRAYITDAAIANPRLLRELNIVAVTPSATAIGATGQFIFPGGMTLTAGQLIYVATSVATGWDVITEGFDF